jgi:hypothetical protein
VKAHGWVGLCCVVSALLGFSGLGVFGVRAGGVELVGEETREKALVCIYL